MRVLLCLFIFYLVKNVMCDFKLCGNNSKEIKSRNCSSQLQIIGQEQADLELCKLDEFPSNSDICKEMVFGPITSNKQIGGVYLKPYIVHYDYKDETTIISENYTVLNITFNNIKWKSMKFRFQSHRGSDCPLRNHCRNIVISNDATIDDQSVLYYDCYWSEADSDYTGQSYYLDFEAKDDQNVVNRGRYLFNIPSVDMLSSTVAVNEWRPFTYIEIHTITMKLHIPPPPSQLKILAYRIELIKQCDKGTQCEEIVKSSMVKLKNSTQEVTYEYSLMLDAGFYYFTVTPLHEECLSGQEIDCQSVESPRVNISHEMHQNLNICIASVTALIVATIFAYYVALRVIRRYWCKDNMALVIANEMQTPPKIVLIYSPANKLHAECVNSFASYLRSEYGFQVMYDGDIVTTSHGDPYIWAEETFRMSTHIIYIASPTEETNLYNNIYDQPIISPHRNIDTLQLNLLKANQASKHPKDVVNVIFDHSNGQLPIETRNYKTFFLLKDWQKLISYLLKNLVPRQQMMRSEKGKCLLEDLKRAKKLLNNKREDVVIKCDNLKASAFEKKVLL